MLARINWWHALLAIFLLPVGLGVYWYHSTHNMFRFRLTMEIEADGKLYAGSSIIEVTYVEGGPHTRRWNTVHEGVTPMIDLGRHGTIVASFTRDGSLYAEKLASVGRPVSGTGEGLPSFIDDLPLDVYNRVPQQLTSSLAKVEVPLERLPALIWLPPGAHWRSAQAILPEEMPSVIDGSVRFVQMTMEPAPRAHLMNRIEPAPNWLLQLREDHKKQYILPGTTFAFHPLKIESEFKR